MAKSAKANGAASSGSPKTPSDKESNPLDLHTIILCAISYPVEAILHSNYLLCFFGTVMFSALFVSKAAACLVLAGALFAWLASFGQRPDPLPRYRGPLDVLMGRKYRASSLTPDMIANNNVSIVAFGDRLVLAYRKADSHFASHHARMIVATAKGTDLEEWTQVWDYATGEDDLREMLLFTFMNRVFLYFVHLEPFKRGFSPRSLQYTSTGDLTTWTEPAAVGREGEIAWDIKVRSPEGGQPVAYKASYVGNHYASGAVCTVLFERSTDAVTWGPVGKDSAVYVGGISEVSFDFTPAGDLVAIGRNEDGDATGFGSQLFFARKGNLGQWNALRISLPYRFDSPRMVEIDGEMILLARYARESYCAMPTWLPTTLQQTGNLITYSAKPKSAAVYRIRQPDQDGEFPKEPVELIRCFEDTFGDTGFFSLAKDEVTGDHVIANYSSTCHSHAPWIYGQLFKTDIYVCRANFVWRRQK